MSPKIKNIIIFVSIAIVLIVLYVVFIKKSPDVAPLTSTSGDTSLLGDANGADSQIASDFLTLLLSVKSISLNDALFSDPAFLSLHDSSIELIPDGTEGRPNPFAPIGSDGSTSTAPTLGTPTSSTNKSTNPPAQAPQH